MKKISLIFAVLLLALSACKSKVCDCADVFVKASEDVRKANQEPLKILEIMEKQNKDKAFQECHKYTDEMTPEELKSFNKEFEQCPSVRSYREKSMK
ncbi:MAG: hypothetical protein WCG64_01090 [Flavobacteriia bacterium]|jgi:hypothetical protein